MVPLTELHHPEVVWVGVPALILFGWLAWNVHRIARDGVRIINVRRSEVIITNKTKDPIEVQLMGTLGKMAGWVWLGNRRGKR